jgi:hypothetical protein
MANDPQAVQYASEALDRYIDQSTGDGFREIHAADLITDILLGFTKAEAVDILSRVERDNSEDRKV